MILVMHYNDVIMNAIPSLITGVSIVYSTVCSGADQRKHQSSASPVTDEFPTQRVSNAEKVSIWWCHHGFPLSCLHNLFHRWNQWWRHHGFPLSCLYNFFIGGTSDRHPTEGLNLPSCSTASIRPCEYWISTLQELYAETTPCYAVHLCFATQSIYSHPPRLCRLDRCLVILTSMKQPMPIMGLSIT